MKKIFLIMLLSVSALGAQTIIDSTKTIKLPTVWLPSPPVIIEKERNVCEDSVIYVDTTTTYLPADTSYLPADTLISLNIICEPKIIYVGNDSTPVIQPPVEELGYFINKNGSNTYPFDKIEKGATSFTNFSNAGGWALLNGGGNLFIAKGTYNEQVTVNTYGTANKKVLIRNSLQPNYTGQVLIDGGNSRDHNMLIDQGCGSSQVGNWITIKGIDMIRAASHGLYLHCNVNNITIDSCKITESGLAGIHIIGNDDYSLAPNGVCAENIKIKNCYIESKYNAPQQETNCVYAQMVAGLEISNNYIHQQNHQIGVVFPNHAHVDCIQTHVVRNAKITNNVCIIDSSILGHGMILGMQSRPNKVDTVIIYNNYVYAGGHLYDEGNPYINSIVLRWYGYSNSVYPPTYLINNTFVSSNGGENTVLQEYAGEFYNNIICQFGSNGQNPSNFGGLGLDAFSSSWNGDKTYVAKCKGNLMWNQWTNNMTFGGNQWVNPAGATVSLSNWASWLSNGGSGINGNPLFNNNYRLRFGYRLASNSPAKNIGENWKTFIESKGFKWVDIEGKLRDTQPNAGCFEN